MTKIATNLTDLIGNTPLLELVNYNQANNLEARLLAKLEYFNPAGSVKDRIGHAMIKDAEDKGLLHKNTVIIGLPAAHRDRSGLCGRCPRPTDTDRACS